MFSKKLYTDICFKYKSDHEKQQQQQKQPTFTSFCLVYFKQKTLFSTMNTVENCEKSLS